MTRSLLVLVVGASLGCASSAKPSSIEPGRAVATEETAEDVEAPPAAPKSKSEQCNVLGEAIENGIAGGTKIVGLNDREAIETLRQEWSTAKERIAAVGSDLPELASLRDDVAALAAQRAEALAIVASDAPEPERKAALARYRELSGQFDGLVDRFNAICGA